MHEIRIEVRQQALDYRVCLVDVTGGGVELAAGSTPNNVFVNGFPDLLYEGLPLTADTLKTAFSSLENKTLSARTVFGEYLFRLLTPGTIAQVWDALREEHDGAGDNLTTLLEFHPEAWQYLPWELLYRGLHLFHHKRHALGLRRPNGHCQEARYFWPLRMLVIVGNTDDEKIKWKQELLAIKRAMCAFSIRVDLKVVTAPLTKQQAGGAIEKFRPHILHFIGHGTSDAGGALELMQRDGSNLRWKRDEIAATLTSLTSDESPRLAVINACQSAGREGVLGDTAVADAFAQIGCPAVVAMRGDIFGKAAHIFSETLYRELANLGINRIDQAFCSAVSAMASDDIDQRVWSLPRIYFQEKAESVFGQDGECCGFERVSKGFDDLKKIRPFVDRDEQRYELYHAANCWLEEGEPEYQVLLVHGPDEIGKTWFLKALLYVASLRRFRISYCDFSDRNYDLESFLEVLRHGSQPETCFFTQPLVPVGAAVDPFAELNHSAEPASLSGNEDRKTPLVEKFARGLKAVGASGPVLLAFDHINKLIMDGCWNYIRSPLIEAATKGPRPGGLGVGVRLAIAANDSDLRTYGLDQLRAKRVELTSLPPQSFEDVVLHYFLHQLRDGDDYQTRLAECTGIVGQVAQLRLGQNKSLSLSELPQIFSILGVK